MTESTCRTTPSATDSSAEEILRSDVVAGLAMPQKELSPKYLYDKRGSELFEEITRLDEYYPTRTERGLLEQWIPVWVGEHRPAAYVELGAGSAGKSRVILEAMRSHGTGNLFVPLDVSADFLHDTARRLRDEYEGLRVVPEVADMTLPLSLSVETPSPTWFGLLGSTIGNFEPPQARQLLGRVATQMRPGDHFLMGADLRPGPNKSIERLARAYDDASGVTAAFNLNVLTVLNRELGTDFDAEAFRHHAFYSAEHGRIEMHLVARRALVVHIPGAEAVTMAEGESIRTEISCKYDRGTVDALFRDAGMTVDRWIEDEQSLFALTLGRKT